MAEIERAGDAEAELEALNEQNPFNANSFAAILNNYLDSNLIIDELLESP